MTKRKLQKETNPKQNIKRLKATKKQSESKITSSSSEKWTNKERVLVFASRGVSYRDRHLMQDIRNLMPHSKPDCKMSKGQGLFSINEICEMKNCSKCVYFEARKKKDLYMWVSNVPHGPSAKFLVQNVHTMLELKLTGNCLKSSRPILSFDSVFDKTPHNRLLKELFIQTFGTPHRHPKSQPFIDHVFNFSIADNRVWFRNYQVVEEDGSLVEIGPRFVLNPIKIFAGSFSGQVLYENAAYKSPNLLRREVRLAKGSKYEERVLAKIAKDAKEPGPLYAEDVTDDVFTTIRPEDAKGIEKSTFYRKR
ncbi:ribosome biogenesis protein BRX1 homolog [Antedon mediterranea]|uniref:ribosome biogenesis protein BRX1 homolog n=1 Tax=Antedon mediterranea TaxID=105859 RepID=UPI003AF74015